MAITTSIEQIQLRQDTGANWTRLNPALALGEEGLDTTAHKRKVGDGLTLWNSLPYFEDVIAAAGAALAGSSSGSAAAQSTTSTDTVTYDAITARALDNLAQPVKWAKANGVKIYVGEFGWTASGNSGYDARYDVAGRVVLDALHKANVPVTLWGTAEWGMDLKPYTGSPLSAKSNVGTVFDEFLAYDAGNGVNFAGADFGQNGQVLPTVPGVENTDYIWPKAESIAYLASVGVKRIRVPFRWERAQRTLGGTLDATFITRMTALLNAAQTNGVTVIADLHNYGAYTPSTGATPYLLGQNIPTTNGLTTMKAAFVDFWTKFATQFGGHAGLFGYGLMNEPYGLSGAADGSTPDGGSTWRDCSAAAAYALWDITQDAKAIIVAGYFYSTARGWYDQNGQTPWLYTFKGSGSDARALSTRPNVFFDTHFYLDSTGTYPAGYDTVLQQAAADTVIGGSAKYGSGSVQITKITGIPVDSIARSAAAAAQKDATAALAASNGSQVAGFKAVTRALSSTTGTVDSDLSVTLAANTTYDLYARVHYTASTTAGIKLGLSLPSGRIDGLARGASLTPIHITGTAAATALNVGAFAGNGAAEQVVEIRVTVTIGSTGGVVGLVAAQNAADTTTSTVLLAQSRVQATKTIAGVSVQTTPTTGSSGGSSSGSTPANTVLATETFTGTTNAAWPSQWVAAAGKGTIVGNAGQMVCADVGYVNLREVLTGPGQVANVESYSEHKVTALTEHYIYASVRTQNSATYNPAGYYLMLRPADPSGGYEVGVGNGAAASTQQGYGELTYIAGHTYGIRINVVGSTVKFRVWDLAGAEPAAWMNTITDATYSNGYFAVSQISGQTTNPVSLVDNVSLTTATATVVSSGTTTDGTEAPVGVPGSWTRTFTDEFTGSSVDTTKWAKNWYGEGGVMNGSGTYAANATVDGSSLILTLADATHGALIHTDISTGYKFPVGSYLEARIKAPSGSSGLFNWPAFWASTASADGWPSQGEHDIFEVLSGQATVNYHGVNSDKNLGTVSGTWGNAFHTFGIYRKAGSADVYWDGVLVKSYTTSDGGKPEIVILNVGTQKPDAFGTASQVFVDYVRAWKPA